VRRPRIRQMLPDDQACGGERPISLHIYTSEPYMGTRAHAADRASIRIATALAGASMT
jgi:hypothetical protein